MLKLVTHPLHLLHFSVDLHHIRPYDLVVLHQVHRQQMIVNQPQNHLTRKPARCFCQLRNLAGRRSIQLVLGVQHRAKVLIVLRGKPWTDIV